MVVWRPHELDTEFSMRAIVQLGTAHICVWLAVSTKPERASDDDVLSLTGRSDF
jgi:hypothetical protein